MTDTFRTSNSMSVQEQCRALCAWKGGAPCLAEDCPRKAYAEGQEAARQAFGGTAKKLRRAKRERK